MYYVYVYVEYNKTTFTNLLIHFIFNIKITLSNNKLFVPNINGILFINNKLSNTF